MGYRNYGYGSFMPVSMQNGKISIYTSLGVETYQTTCMDIVEKAIFKFDLNGVLFYLENSENSYVGRKDGSLSVFQKKDSLLLGIYKWEIPKFPVLQNVGAATLNGKIVVLSMDLNNRRILYPRPGYCEFVMDKEWVGSTFMPTSIANGIRHKDGSVHLVDINGNEVNCSDDGHWTVQDEYKVPYREDII